MPLLKKGAYYFANVGRSVGMSVDHVLSAQYLLNQYQTWCRCCPQWVDDSCRYSSHMFKGQMFKGQWQTIPQPTVLPAQYLLTPSFDQYQTWCRGCPQWVDDLYWFSGHMFKGQGQTTLLSPLCCQLNIFWPLHLINTKLCVGVVPNK